ncbi:hypothetical protein FACS1894187_02530 [Synergistales bacterium]|nr:hypothetical protein FACS1894187_02530 [Synergistales bacterium]
MVGKISLETLIWDPSTPEQIKEYEQTRNKNYEIDTIHKEQSEKYNNREQQNPTNQTKVAFPDVQPTDSTSDKTREDKISEIRAAVEDGDMVYIGKTRYYVYGTNKFFANLYKTDELKALPDKIMLFKDEEAYDKKQLMEIPSDIKLGIRKNNFPVTDYFLDIEDFRDAVLSNPLNTDIGQRIDIDIPRNSVPYIPELQTNGSPYYTVGDRAYIDKDKHCEIQAIGNNRIWYTETSGKEGCPFATATPTAAPTSIITNPNPLIMAWQGDFETQFFNNPLNQEAIFRGKKIAESVIRPDIPNITAESDKTYTSDNLKGDFAMTTNKDFFELCAQGTLAEVNTAIENGADVNTENKYGETPLMIAALKNTDPEVLSVLLKNGADVNAKSDDRTTALIFAAQCNENPKATKILLDSGADINAVDEYDDMSPLANAAAYNPNIEVISLLLENGANINLQNSSFGVTPLMYAAKFTFNPEIITTLLKSGADPLIKDNAGRTAIEYAWNNVSLTKSVAFRSLHELTYPDTKQQQTQNIEGSFPKKKEDALTIQDFSDLCANGTSAEVEAAIQSGADVNKIDILHGTTPLMYAAYGNADPKVIETLLKNGADIDAIDCDSMTSLMYAAVSDFFDEPKIISTLLDYGADPHIMNNSGSTALDYARDNKSLRNTDAIRQLEETTNKEITPPRYSGLER